MQLVAIGGVLRVGSWATSNRLEMQSSYRNVVDRNEGDVIYGIRCVLATKPDGDTKKRIIGHRFRTSKIKPACDGRSACQRPLEAAVCDRVGADVPEWLGRPLSAYVRENRAGVYAFVSMADRCVS